VSEQLHLVAPAARYKLCYMATLGR